MATILSFKVKSFLSECLKEVATILSFKVKISLSESEKEVATILSFKVKSTLSESEKESGNNIILQGEEFPVRMFERQQYCPSR